MATTSNVETAVATDASKIATDAKADVSKVETAAVSFYKTELVKAKAELAKLESETWSTKVVAIVFAVGVVVGLVAPHVLKHL